jgi:hypothetical protein
MKRVSLFLFDLLVRRSTLIIESTQGSTKKRPGPLAPPGKQTAMIDDYIVILHILPERIRPKRMITARSYSWTTYT